MKITKIALAAIVLLQFTIGLSYAFVNPKAVETGEKDPVYDSLSSLTKGNLFVWELGTGDYLLEQKLVTDHPELAQFFADNSKNTWYVRFNKRTNKPHFLWGAGLKVLNKNANVSVEELDQIGRGLILKYNDLFPVKQDNLVLDKMTGRVAKNSNKHFIRYFIRHNGVDFQRAFIFFRISYGKVIQIGFTGLEEWQWLDTNPAIAKEKALNVSLTFAHLDRKHSMIKEPRLKIVTVSDNPFATAQEAEAKQDYKLVWELLYSFAGVEGTWLSWIDAHSGEVVLFADNTFYANKGKVAGGIFLNSPDTNLDTVPGQNCSGAKDMDPQVMVPFFDVTLRGLPVLNPISSIGGMYRFAGVGQAYSSLDGAYFDANDSWFPTDPDVYAYLNYELDLGTGGVDFVSSSIIQDPTTSAARNAYYHLNRARLLAIQWLENLEWLYTTVPVYVNFQNHCNATWSGAGYGTFYASSCLFAGICSGGNRWICHNSGESASIMMHEWGHGIDNNIGSGQGDISTSEGVGDVMSFFNSHEDCLAPGFLIWDQCCVKPPCTDGIVYAYMANAACRAKGALRSAESYEDQFATNPIATDADCTTDNVMTRCYTCDDWYCGPLSREGHCEGQVLPQAIWDLRKALQAEPQHLINGSWKYTEYLFYGTLAYGAEVYLSILPDNYYDGLLAIDDDDGDLTNGTPHGGLIHDNYGLHDLFVTTPVQTSPHCVASQEPVLTGTVVADLGVQLNWTPVSGADHYVLYWLYAGVNGPAYALYEGSATSFTYETTVAGTYYFAVQAIGADGCPSLMEGTVTKTVGNASVPDLAVSNVSLTDDSPNGNGDGYGDIGETVDFDLELTNQGQITASDINVELVAPSGAVIIIQKDSQYGDIAPGASGMNSTPFRAYLTRTLPCGGNVKFMLKITTAERYMEKQFEVYMGSMTNVYLSDFETALGPEWSLSNDGNSNAQFMRIPDITTSPWYAYPVSPTGALGWNNDPITANNDKVILNTSSFWSDFPKGYDVKMNFWHSYAVEKINDELTLEISTDNGTTWTDLGSKIVTGKYDTQDCLNSAECWSDDNTGNSCLSGAMTEVVVDMNEYLNGNPPRIMWHARSNATCDWWGCPLDDPSDGWMIDDVAFATCKVAENRPLIALYEVAIEDPDPEGNMNGALDQGETVAVILTLKNESLTLGLTNITGVITTDDPGVTILDGDGTFGDLDPNSTGDNAADPFAIKYVGPCKDYIKLLLKLDSDQGAIALEVNVTVGLKTIFEDDAEDGVKPNYTSSGGWIIYNGPYHTSGTKAWYVDNYNWGSEETLDLSVSIPSESAVVLSYNHTYAFEDFYDGVRLYLSDDQGSNWTDLGPYMLSGGYNDTWLYDGDPIWTNSPFIWGNGYPPPTPTWEEVTVDLSDWAGKDVILRWWEFSDANADSCVESGGGYGGVPCQPWPLPTWGDGMLIDDIKITAQTCIYCNFPEFTDTTSNFARYYIRKLQCAGVASGCNATQYCPANLVLRSQMAKFVLMAAQISPAASCTGVFTDVSSSNPFCTFIEKLAETGIASGCTATQYCPSNAVSRAQMAAFLIRAMGLPAASECTEMFTDVTSSNIFCTYIEELANQGVTSGCAPNLYCPNAPVKRDQMSIFLVKAFDL